MSPRPQDRTIRQVVAYLESMGLGVYGPNTDLSDGELRGGFMDLSGDEVVKYRKLHEKDAFWVPEEFQ